MKIAMITLSILIISCANQSKQSAQTKPKNVILMIGDGMGPQQISLLYYFSQYSKLNVIAPDDFAFQKFNDKGSSAISATEPYDKMVVDSACSATQLAIGEASRSEMIGLDKSGNPKKTILNKAQARGMKVGLVSDTRITHATPASFASAVANRWQESEIAAQMLQTSPDLMYSGGLNQFIPQGEKKNISGIKVTSRRNDNKNLLELAKKKYHIIHKKDELDLETDKKVLGLFTNSGMPDAIWQSKNKDNKERSIPNLLEMTQSAVNYLDKKSDQGFFLMVEGGQIDWAGHRNDAGTMLHELIHFNQTLNWLLDWIEKNPDTLLVVTADHETGAFGIGYNVHNLPEPVTLKGSAFGKRKFRPNFNYGDFKVLDQMYLQKKSFHTLWSEFSRLDKKEQTPEKMKKKIEDSTEFKITLETAKKVLRSKKNKYKNDWHYNLKGDTLPRVDESEAYYYDAPNIRTALIGRTINEQQNVIWGTGGHTATPVTVFAIGGGDYHKKFSGYLNHRTVGKLMQEYLGL